MRYSEGHIVLISAVNYRSPSGLVAAVPLASPCFWHHPQITFSKGEALEASEHHPEEGESGKGLSLGYAAPWDACAGGIPPSEGVSHVDLRLP